MDKYFTQTIRLNIWENTASHRGPGSSRIKAENVSPNTQASLWASGYTFVYTGAQAPHEDGRRGKLTYLLDCQHYVLATDSSVVEALCYLETWLSIRLSLSLLYGRQYSWSGDPIVNKTNVCDSSDLTFYNVSHVLLIFLLKTWGQYVGDIYWFARLFFHYIKISFWLIWVTLCSRESCWFSFIQLLI